MLVVVALESAYDTRQGRSTRRNVTAVALAAGIAVVAFGQYRRLVSLGSSGLEAAFTPKASPLARDAVVRTAGGGAAEGVGGSGGGGRGAGIAGRPVLAAQEDAEGCRLFPRMLALGASLRLRSWSDGRRVVSPTSVG
jgi:hypothetical protein